MKNLRRKPSRPPNRQRRARIRCPGRPPNGRGSSFARRPTVADGRVEPPRMVREFEAWLLLPPNQLLQRVAGYVDPRGTHADAARNPIRSSGGLGTRAGMRLRPPAFATIREESVEITPRKRNFLSKRRPPATGTSFAYVGKFWREGINKTLNRVKPGFPAALKALYEPFDAATTGLRSTKQGDKDNDDHGNRNGKASARFKEGRSSASKWGHSGRILQSVDYRDEEKERERARTRKSSSSKSPITSSSLEGVEIQSPVDNPKISPPGLVKFQGKGGFHADMKAYLAKDQGVDAKTLK